MADPNANLPAPDFSSTQGAQNTILQWWKSLTGQDMTDEQLQLLQDQINRVQAVQTPNLPNVSPDLLGQSAVAQMSPDEGTRSQQLQAIAEIQNVINQGGLNYADKASLEQATQAASNQQNRAMATVGADAASRGQLNSGNRLMMDMNAAQTGANAERTTDLAAAADAQQRKLSAINDAAAQVSQLRGEDWGENLTAANAKDQRDQLNAAAQNQANYYNAGVPQQNFNNQMSKATGTGNPTNALGTALQQAGVQQGQLAGGAVGVAGAVYNAANGGGGSGSPYTYTYDPGEQSDLSGNVGGPQTLGNPKDDT